MNLLRTNLYWTAHFCWFISYNMLSKKGCPSTLAMILTWYTFVHKIFSGVWWMKIFCMEKIFLSMDGISMCHVFGLKFYLSYFQMRVLLHIAFGSFACFLIFTKKTMTNENSFNAMDENISSIAEIYICWNHPWKETSHRWKCRPWKQDWKN